MTKQELLDAINSTIATNGVKGITAESLANILTEIVNAAPEGGSGGSGGNIVKICLNQHVGLELTDEELVSNADAYVRLLNGDCDTVVGYYDAVIEDFGMRLRGNIPLQASIISSTDEESADEVTVMLCFGESDDTPDGTIFSPVELLLMADGNCMTV